MYAMYAMFESCKSFSWLTLTPLEVCSLIRQYLERLPTPGYKWLNNIR